MKLLFVCVVFVVAAYSDLISANESDDISYQAFETYRKIYDSSENLVYSPLSFRVLYSILYQTSFGASETELRSQLFATTHDGDKKTIQSAQSTVLDRILSSDKVKLANKLYLAQGTTLNPDFKTLVAKYKSEVEQVNFGDGAKIANEMNQWVEEKTNHLIKNLIEPDSVTADTALFLINTLYFKAKWLTPFTKYAVINSTFNSIDGSKSEIDFITDVDSYNVVNSDDLKVDVLELPYEQNSNFVFWIIVPHAGSSLDELKTNLNPEFIHKINSTLGYWRTSIKFPTFTIESGVDGKKISKAIFEKAELNMLENSGPLKVDVIKQKTKIIVDTAGTEAASSTYAKIVPLSGYSGEPKNFIADRPFVFAILTDDHKEPLFVGHYVNANK